MEGWARRWARKHGCLNPYYNGRYSWRCNKWGYTSDLNIVLILIIMEDTHGEVVNKSINYEYSQVLILIIMEDTHGAINAAAEEVNNIVS